MVAFAVQRIYGEKWLRQSDVVAWLKEQALVQYEKNTAQSRDRALVLRVAAECIEEME